MEEKDRIENPTIIEIEEKIDVSGLFQILSETLSKKFNIFYNFRRSLFLLNNNFFLFYLSFR